MSATDPKSALEWRAVQAALLADVRAFTAIADIAITEPTLPPLLATDYGLRLSAAYRDMARAAQDAADQAGLYADELEDRDLALLAPSPDAGPVWA